MTLETALRATEFLLALAFLQQSAEHIIWVKGHRTLFLPRVGLSVLLLIGIQTSLVLLALSLHSLFVLRRFAGPYNGGSDRMGLLILYCLTLARLLPEGIWTEAAFGYLGIQVVLSYFVSGWVKIANSEWRSGAALRDVFAFSAYPMSEDLRGLADRHRLIWTMSWSVMLFEVLFPFGLLHTVLLLVVLGIAAAFHLANAVLFGLNRFFWFWIAAYPSLIWLQARLVPMETLP